MSAADEGSPTAPFGSTGRYASRSVGVREPPMSGAAASANERRQDHHRRWSAGRGHSWRDLSNLVVRAADLRKHPGC